MVFEDENHLHGWFYFKQNNYTAVWDQVVRQGGYEDCVISLGLRPIGDDHIWRDNPLSVVTADFRFDRKPTASRSADQPAPRKGFFAQEVIVRRIITPVSVSMWLPYRSLPRCDRNPFALFEPIQRVIDRGVAVQLA